MSVLVGYLFLNHFIVLSLSSKISLLIVILVMSFPKVLGFVLATVAACVSFAATCNSN